VDTAYTWPNEVLFERTCLRFTCHTYRSPETELDSVWGQSGRLDFQQRAASTVDANVVSSATATVQQFLAERQKFLYDSVANALGNPSTPAAAAVRKMNAARRLLQAYTQLGLPIAVQSDMVLSSLLSGQFKLLGELPTEPTITDAVHTASNNYGCGATCTFDAQRPIRNQTFFESSDAPCAGSAAGPGDPLGNCLVEHALRRVENVGARLEVHFKQLADGDYDEQLPSVATTLDELRVSDRLSHPEAVTGGTDPALTRVGWTVSADSEEIAEENGRASNVLDGNTATIWHSAWSSTPPAPLPHQLTIDMHATNRVSGLSYLPRQDGGQNGRIGQYRIETSADGTAWTTRVANGAFADNPAIQTVVFPAVGARFVRFTAQTEAGTRGPWSSAAEITLLGPSG
jgi:hypothetical protein